MYSGGSPLSKGECDHFVLLCVLLSLAIDSLPSLVELHSTRVQISQRAKGTPLHISRVPSLCSSSFLLFHLQFQLCELCLLSLVRPLDSIWIPPPVQLCASRLQAVSWAVGGLTLSVPSSQGLQSCAACCPTSEGVVPCILFGFLAV